MILLHSLHSKKNQIKGLVPESTSTTLNSISMEISQIMSNCSHEFRLRGRLCGYPFPEVIWLKNGVEIDPLLHSAKYDFEVKEGLSWKCAVTIGKLRVASNTPTTSPLSPRRDISDGSFTMEIADCTPDDSDVYTLIVENMAGVDSCCFQLMVNGSGELCI